MAYAPLGIWHRFLPLLGSLLLIVLVFWPALSGGFIFDDYPIFAENQAIHVNGWHWQAWHAVWAWSLANVQRPLAMLSYALNYALGGSTWGFKAVNLAIHLLNTVLLFLLTKRLMLAGWSARLGENIERHHQRLGYWSLAVAFAWAVHPLQVSAVMYVVQRMELMGFTFVLLALLAYWHARQRQLTGQRSWPWLLLCAALVAVGYLAKETVVLVPGYAWLIEVTLLHFAAARSSVERRWKIAYMIGFVAALALFVAYLLPHYATAAAYQIRDYTAWQRELTQLRALPMYLGWSLLPLPDQLHFYYDNYPVSTDLLHPITTLLGGLILVGLLSLGVAVRKRRPLLALGIGWFFMAHLLTSSPLPLELVFEHRNYPALFGVLLVVADLMWLLACRIKSGVPGLVVCVLILNLAFLTALRAATWASPLFLATSLASMNPDSPRAALDLARRYVAMSGDNPANPLYSLGIQQLERAARLPTSSILPEDALLIQSAAHPGTADGPWWTSLQQKLRTRPLGPETNQALYGLVQQRLGGNIGIDARQLAEAYKIVVARNPDRLTLRTQYAELAAAALHDPTTAIEQWQAALPLRKDTDVYARELAGYLVDHDRGQEALAVIAKAQSMRPKLSGDKVLLALRTKALAQLTAPSATSPAAITKP
ncbi:hypothetical protein [Rhodanobacter sp. L36]|uniref:hypothetical protein n=1 Tax=Rhodanobacter sp. L36 TaxID=1747221 RepID=UPI00131ADFB5|nr:hypothetical protein [Rhodanobacter sp. L36]